jgi:hypothetical protein
MVIERRGILPSGHGFKIERTNPEKDAQRLAIRLGEAIQAGRVAQQNADFYNQEVLRIVEEKQELEELLRRVRRRDAGEPVISTSRMDPMKTYDAGALQLQIRTTDEKARQFRKLAQENMVIATMKQKEADDVSRELDGIKAEHGHNL